MFAEVAQAGLAGDDRRRVLDVVRAEARVRDAVIDHLTRRARPVVDVLPALRESLASGGSLYDRNHDGHPTSEGYAVIARAVNTALDAPGSPPDHPRLQSPP